MEKFSITVYRKPWNQTAQAALDIAQSIAEHPDLYDVNSILAFSLALKKRLLVWCQENKKNQDLIDIRSMAVLGLWINKPNSTEPAAITIRLNHVGHIVYGPQGSRKTGKAINIPLSRGLAFEEFNALNFEPEFIDNSPEYFSTVKAIVIDECPPEYPARFTEQINKGKILFVFICQQEPVLNGYPPFELHKCYVPG